MPVSNRINPSSKLNNDTGFSNTGNINGGRFINRNGTFNLRKIGWPFWDRFSIYHAMISLPLWQFIAVIYIFFACINLLYAGIYVWIGVNQLTGLVAQS